MFYRRIKDDPHVSLLEKKKKVYYKAIKIVGINNVPYFANIFDKSTSYFLLGSYVVLPVF